MAPKYPFLPSTSSSLLLEGGLRGLPIQSMMYLLHFLLFEVASSSSNYLPFATLPWSDCRNSLAAAAALVTFRVSVIINI